ncbi:MAG: methyl-accepting chemotaxis protein [Deltaproteobacteria bacterium]|nr:methyl-accepting chemotaxis protein [Deltaproteobacteria bacterium]
MRVGLRVKIMFATVGLTVLILIVNAFVAWDLTSRVIERGQFLDSQIDRFHKFVQVSYHQTLSVESRVIARDPELVDLLANGELKKGKERVQHLLNAYVKEGADLIIVADRASAPVFAVVEGREVGRDVLTKQRLVVDLRQSLDTRKEPYILFEGNAYVFGGASMRRPIYEKQADGTVVEKEGMESFGSVIFGTNLNRVMNEFSLNSDSDEERRVQLIFTSGNKVVSSSLPSEKWQVLWSSIAATERATGDVHPVLRLEGRNYDKFEQSVSGYNESKLATIGNFRVLRSRELVEQFKGRMVKTMYVISGVAIGSALVFGWLIAWVITRNLRRFIEVSRDIAEGEGDLSRRVDIQSKDELGELARNLNRVFGKLGELAARVQGISTSVASSSTQICGSAQSMLGGAREQATRIHDSTAAVTEMSASIQQVAENASQATKVAQEGGQAVNRAIDGMSRIRTTVEDAAEKIRALGESSKRIGNIVEVIRQISEQTSLLALNASIEAAHAGEHGRGFSVVADEVSQLAERTGQSAKDIEDLIATIKTQTEEAVLAMRKGQEEVVDGSTLVSTTLSNLTAIVEVVQDTATAVKEQAIASDEIARNMDAVQRITQNVLSTSEETCGLGQRLVEAANLLEQSVSRFKIATTAGTNQPGMSAGVVAASAFPGAHGSPSTPLLNGKHHAH